MPIGCVACDTEFTPGATRSAAFICGMLFALQFNKDAIQRQLCPRHQQMLLDGHLRTRDHIPYGDRR